jgi:hypothetical protein
MVPSTYFTTTLLAQTDRDWQWFPDAGNGIWTNGQYVSPNDPNDANVPADSAFLLGWMQPQDPAELRPCGGGGDDAGHGSCRTNDSIWTLTPSA